MIENSWLTYLSWISLTLFKDSHCSYLQYLWQNVPRANYAGATHEKWFIFVLNCSHVVVSRSCTVWHNIHLLYKVPDFISVYHVCLRHLLYKLKNLFQLKKLVKMLFVATLFLIFFILFAFYYWSGQNHMYSRQRWCIYLFDCIIMAFVLFTVDCIINSSILFVPLFTTS